MEINFCETYENNFILIEVPPSIAESLKNNEELIIKGGEQSILCTTDKSYELKYLETTNNFLLLSNPAMSDPENTIIKKEITMMTNHTLECMEYNPKKYTISNILKQECSLIYDIETGEDNFSKFEVRYTLNELFAMSELCRVEFDKMVNNYGIFDKNGYACVFNDSFLFSILDDILIMLSKEDLDFKKILIDEIFSEKGLISVNKLYANLIGKFSNSEKHTIMKNTFDYIQDHSSSDFYYKLNLDKVKLFCARNIFHIKKEADFRLEDFISLLKNMLIVSLPYGIIDKFTLENLDYKQTNGEDNLFEGYKDFDLRFLKGHCVIYFLKTQRDPLIK